MEVHGKDCLLEFRVGGSGEGIEGHLGHDEGLVELRAKEGGEGKKMEGCQVGEDGLQDGDDGHGDGDCENEC